MTSEKIFSLALKCCFILCLPFISHAQVAITGKVIDSASRNPIPLVSIYFASEGTKYLRGTVSDDVGNFKLDVPASFLKDTLQLTHIGYTTLRVKIDSTKVASSSVFEMKEAATFLQTVTVSPVQARNYIEECLRRKRGNYFDVTFNNKCFLWQWIKEDRNYKYLTQSYYSVHENLTKDVIKYETRLDSSLSDYTYFHLPFSEDIQQRYVFDIMRMGRQFAGISNLDEWKFTFDNTSYVANDYVWINGVTRDGFVKTRMLVNENNYAIEQIDYSINWNNDIDHDLNDTLAYRMKDLNGKIFYKKNQTKYFAQVIQNHINYTVYRKGREGSLTRLCERESQNELVVFSSNEQRDPSAGPDHFSKKDFDSKIQQQTIVINKRSFCDAASVLHYETTICKQ